MKKRISKIAGIVSFFAIFAMGATYGAEPPAPKTVTVDEAVQLALQNNISLESSAIDLRMKKRGADRSWNVLIPTVQATGTAARTNMDSVTVSGLVSGPSGIQYVSMETDLDENQRWSAIGGLSATLNLNAALVEGIRATRKNYEAGKITWEQAKQETELNVKKAFYGLLVQEESLKISKDKLATSEERLRQTRANYKNGIVPELTLLQAQLSVETQKPTIKEAETSIDYGKNQFAFLIGLPVGTKIKLDGSIDPAIADFDADSLVEKHLGNSYALQLLQAQGQMQDIQVRALKLQTFTPSLSLSKSWSPTISPIDEDWSDRDNWTDSSGAFSITLAFNLTNILPFSANGSSIADAEDSAKKINLAIEMTRLNEEIEIRNLVEKLATSKDSIAAMELNVTIAQKAYQLSEQGYKAGTIEYLDLKDAENSLLSARIGVLSEKYNYLSMLLDLEKSLNAKLY